jgi:membrane protein
VLALGFLLAVSLVISTVLAASVNLAVSLCNDLDPLCHAVQMVPRHKRGLERCLVRGGHRALLFNLGKGLIPWYIGTQGLESTYGAAASVVALLI